MTVGGGGLNADRAKYYALLHALSLSRLRDSSLPEGAFDGGGRGANADGAVYETKLGGTRVSLLGEKPLRRRTNARSARLPHAGSPTNNQKRRKPFRRADSSEGYRGLPRRAFGICSICSHTRQRSSRRVANFFFASFFLFGKEKS